MKNSIIVLTTSFTLILISCKKEFSGCAVPDIIASATYDNPVWHPSGNSIGFNYLPLRTITKHGKGGCSWISYTYNTDSAGFWLINADGTNMHRALPYSVIAPAWSPDGKWLAFSNSAGTLIKIPFGDNQFDTAHTIQLTTENRNWYPSWNPAGDSIVFDSWDGGQHSLYRIWKMAADGKGKIEIDSIPSREPFWYLPDKIIHLRYDTLSPPFIYAMNSSGKEVRQINFNRIIKDISLPKAKNGHIYFIGQGATRFALYRADLSGRNLMKLTTDGCHNFSIGPDGKIVYSNFIGELDQDKGTLWIMNADGSNKRQLTQNRNYVVINN